MRGTENQSNYGVLPAEGFVRVEKVCEFFDISKSSLWQGIKENKYPGPVKFSSRVARWDVQELRTWTEKQKGIQNEE